MQDGLNRYVKFQSTPSARRATRRIINQLRTIINFNPRPPRGGRHHRREPRDRLQIHFNPRPPRGGRPAFAGCFEDAEEFQSTPSARRATRRRPQPPRGLLHFNPRPPRGGRQSVQILLYTDIQFQSTPSARRATDSQVELRQRHPISIHALREEGDRPFSQFVMTLGYFNPRPPRGGRRHQHQALPGIVYFNPRPPRGGRRRKSGLSPHTVRFQSTPSARRATQSSCLVSLALQFQSTPSARRATKRTNFTVYGYSISIHALREEGDGFASGTTSTASYFNPRPPRGGRHSVPVGASNSAKFQSTPSARRATHFAT